MHTHTYSYTCTRTPTCTMGHTKTEENLLNQFSFYHVGSVGPENQVQVIRLISTFSDCAVFWKRGGKSAHLYGTLTEGQTAQVGE